MSHIQSLQLSAFRSYSRAELADLPSSPIVLTGANGAGKTNVLEAISLLTPGRGLRGAKVAEMQQRDAGAPWAVAADVSSAYGPVKLGTGGEANSDRRLVRVNGASAPQSTLAEYLSCLWLTPQMDGLFLGSAGSRRRFFDRLVYAFDPGHAGRLTRYENAIAQRAKILREHLHPDPAWLTALETTAAESGVAVAAARNDLVAQLNGAVRVGDAGIFPVPDLSIDGSIEGLLNKAPAVEVERMFAFQLTQTRGQDAVSGGAATGPHRSDFAATYREKSMPADQCSTGEQKALLIGIVLAQARLVANARGGAPILLLDELAAHLDEPRRGALFAILQDLGGQVWMTGADAGLFDQASASAFLHVENGEVRPQ